jgi:hypothetical protein
MKIALIVGTVLTQIGVLGAAIVPLATHEPEPLVHFTVDDYQVAATQGAPIPPQFLWEEVTSEDGGLLVWSETDKEGTRHQYQRRIPASDPNADENRLPWDMKRVGKDVPDDWKVEDYIEE